MNLNQITIPVNNMSKAIDFYLTLGLTQIVDSPHYARFSSPSGNSTLSLILEDTEIFNGTTIYFEEEQLDSWVKNLIKKGIKFEQFPADQPYLWREAICHDPSGNKIKLYWAGINRLNPPWRVEIKH